MLDRQFHHLDRLDALCSIEYWRSTVIVLPLCDSTL